MLTQNGRNTVLQSLIDNVLKLIKKLDFPINRPAFKVPVGAPHVDGVKRVHTKPVE